MKTLTVDLGGKLPEGQVAMAIFFDHVNIINGDTIEIGIDRLSYCGAEVKFRKDGDYETGDYWAGMYEDTRIVTVEFPAIQLPKGIRAYGLIVQPDKPIEAILSVVSNEKEVWYELPKDLKIELLNC